jgi:hypothetical protein
MTCLRRPQGTPRLGQCDLAVLSAMASLSLLVGCSGKSDGDSSGPTEYHTTEPYTEAQLDELIVERTVDVGTADILWTGSNDNQFSALIAADNGAGQVMLAQGHDLYVLDALPRYDGDPMTEAIAEIVSDDVVTLSNRGDVEDQFADLDGDGANDLVIDVSPVGMTVFYGPFVGEIAASDYDAVFFSQPEDGDTLGFFSQSDTTVGALEEGGPTSIAVVGWDDSKNIGMGEAHLLTAHPEPEQWIRDVSTATLLNDECKDMETTFHGGGHCTIGEPEIYYVGDSNGDGFTEVAWSAPRLKLVYVFEGPLEGTMLADDDATLLQGGYAERMDFLGGDFDGDGTSDVAVQDATGGGVRIYLAPYGSAPSATIDGLVTDFGLIEYTMLNGPGDVDGDGSADLAALCSYAGAALFLGPFVGATDIRDAQFIFSYDREELTDPNYSIPPKHLGDVNGDGVSDFFVKGGDYTTEFSYLGIFYGGSSWGPR